MDVKSFFRTLTDKFSGKGKILFLLITVIAGIIILWPLHNFQHYLAQGDHGRDLYCFKKTLDGAVPYRDYSWLFGPLMPYYYSLFYLLGGISIQSVLVGQGILVLIAGVLVYLICAAFLPPALSFVCAFWYWSFRGPEFFYTYNHIGGLVALLVALYCAFQYIRENKDRYVYIGSFSIFLLMLIRLNMGIFILLAFVGSLILADLVQKNPRFSRQLRLYVFLSLAVLALTACLYWFLLRDLPDYAVYQSFPFNKMQRTDAATSVPNALGFIRDMLVSYFSATVAQQFFGILLLVSFLQSLVLIFSKSSPQDVRRKLALIFITLFFFLILGSHEYVASGVFYRLFWIYPMIYLIVFYLIGISTRNISSFVIKTLIALTLFLPSFWNIQNTNRGIQSFKNPFHMLNIGKNKIYTLQHPSWFQGVTDAVRYLKENTRPDETILVLPLDPLYLFLSERDSAARQLVFFEHINIPEEQERETIREMEANNGNWAVISNRSEASFEGGLGTFGKTYCLILAQYLNDHFETVATFGDWANPAGWAWNHGVKILKRK